MDVSRGKHDLRRRLTSLIPSYIAHHSENVASFSPETSSLTTTSGAALSYDTLIVAAGLKINFEAIENLTNHSRIQHRASTQYTHTKRVIKCGAIDLL
ncbi:hypothetical protein BOTBODRAFT_513141 [Botryobasidium botryosum FD-172 SS1]|uniref:FAD/NAD(P)-binding domain-containing protein n=1 Tax=Botryobasidium botryosum (strain FD-172 SS1) TaxID=930990 RepID=A0A067N3Z9_BOTB1|nr:hypothetical protein BOTBODRAFT_513141 [Botryobasidium botryosum FD-172 SS1]